MQGSSFGSLRRAFIIKVHISVNQRFALKDAADAHKALEARATSGATILTI